MRDELGGKIMTNFARLIIAKTYSYLIDDGNQDKRANNIKKGVIKRKVKFRGYEKCAKTSQIENIINYLEKKETDADSLKESIKYKKVIVKIQQRFKSGRHNVFTEKNNKIALR